MRNNLYYETTVTAKALKTKQKKDPCQNKHKNKKYVNSNTEQGEHVYRDHRRFTAKIVDPKLM